VTRAAHLLLPLVLVGFRSYRRGKRAGRLLGFVAVPFLFGVLFVLVYYRTGNLFVPIGTHALVNDPVTMVNAGPVLLFPLPAVIVGIIAGRPYVALRLDRRGREATPSP